MTLLGWAAGAVGWAALVFWCWDLRVLDDVPGLATVAAAIVWLVAYQPFV